MIFDVLKIVVVVGVGIGCLATAGLPLKRAPVLGAGLDPDGMQGIGLVIPPARLAQCGSLSTPTEISACKAALNSEYDKINSVCKVRGSKAVIVL